MASPREKKNLIDGEGRDLDLVLNKAMVCVNFNVGNGLGGHFDGL